MPARSETNGTISIDDPTYAIDLKTVIEWRWSCSATLAQTVPVRALLEGNRTWDVVVHIFDLADCAKADRLYAWLSPRAGDTQRCVFTSLHIGPIKSPVHAVCATVADELRINRLARRTRAVAHASWRSVHGHAAGSTPFPAVI